MIDAVVTTRTDDEVGSIILSKLKNTLMLSYVLCAKTDEGIKGRLSLNL